MAGAQLVGVAQPPPRLFQETAMAKDQKIIRAKAGLLELAKQLGDVGQACKIMGFEPATASTGSRTSTTKAGSWRFGRCRAASRS